MVRGGAEPLAEYEAPRDRISRGLLDTNDRIASFEWDLEEAKDLHLMLSREMKTEVERILEFDSEP